MCGIAGYYNFRSGRPADRGVVEAMTRAMRHRGPDDEGYLVEGPLALGMRRLSIIDLAGGHQPIGSEDGGVQLVFNGEIYNHRALRRDLEAAGHRFRTRADTEVVVHGYEVHGDRVLDHLNGMFGLALWDAAARRLLLARDRLGVKPLYWTALPGGIAFASELKALLIHPEVERRFDPEALRQYLAWEYIPAPRTPFAGIHKMPAATLLAVDPSGWRQEVYWRLRPGPLLADPVEAEEELRRHLERSVRLQMEADVPVGAFLSGGLDSSALVATLCAVRGGPVHTFSIGFGEADFDETAHARKVAETLGTVHREEILTPDCLDLVHQAAGFLDEPFADNSILPTYLVSRVARESVKVALSGDGGDELFAGYDHYKAERLLEWYARVPAPARRAALGVMGRDVDRRPTKHGGVRRRLRRLEAALEGPAFLSQARFMVRSRDEVRSGLLPDPGPEDAAAGWAEPFAAVVRDSPFPPGLAHQQFIDLKTFLADDILMKTDRASMAVSLEARVPYLDHELVEFAFRLAPRLKLRGLVGKWILRRAFRTRLPASILRRRKSGFSVPIGAWLRGDLRTLAHDLLDPKRLARQGLFDPARTQALLAEHVSGRADHARLLWALVMFELWHDRWAAAAPAAIVRPAVAAAASAGTGGPA
jgi:asparagine synthase (glutamine-hydrolysing)